MALHVRICIGLFLDPSPALLLLLLLPELYNHRRRRYEYQSYRWPVSHAHLSCDMIAVMQPASHQSCDTETKEDEKDEIPSNGS